MNYRKMQTTCYEATQIGKACGFIMKIGLNKSVTIEIHFEPIIWERNEYDPEKWGCQWNENDGNGRFT